jgi:hypothetical protein
MKNIIPSKSFNGQKAGQLKHPINGRPSEKFGMVAVNGKINHQNDPLYRKYW